MRSRTTRRPRGRLRALAVAGAALALVVGVAAAPAQALAPTTIDANAWGVNGRVRAILETPSAVYIGGEFTAVVSPTGATMARNNIAALDPATGAPLPFNPGVDQQVIDLSISPDGRTLYAAGDFKTAAGVTRGRAAAFDATSGALKPFDPKANLTIEAIQASASGVYIGGQFTKLKSVARNFLAEVDPSTGAVLPAFTATTDAKVHDIVLGAAGTQALRRRQVRRRVRAVRAGQAGGPQPVHRWPAALAGPPERRDLQPGASDGQVFAAGGGSGGHAYGFDIGTGRQLWTSLSNGDIHAVALQNGVLYVGGHFTTYNGVDASHIAAISPTTGRRIPWGVNVNSKLGIWSVAAFAGHLSIGGDFTRINGKLRQHYARFIEAVDTLRPDRARKAGRDGARQHLGRTHLGRLQRQHRRGHHLLGLPRRRQYADRPGHQQCHVRPCRSPTRISSPAARTPGSAGQRRRQHQCTQPGERPLDPADPGFPVLTSMVMQDVNTDGKVDRVVATFSEPVTCTAPCLTPVDPGQRALGRAPLAVTAAGTTCHADHRSRRRRPGHRSRARSPSHSPRRPTASSAATGASRTSRRPHPPTAPGRCPTDITSTNGPTPNVMEPGDTFTATFSEPIDPASVHQGNVKEFDTGATGNDQLIIVGLSGGASIDLGSNDYVTQNMGTIVFQDSTLTLLSGNTKIRSTIVGACTGTACGATGPGCGRDDHLRARGRLTDLAGNGAVGSHTEPEAPY